MSAIEPTPTATNHRGNRFRSMSLNSWLLASNAAFFALSSFALIASIAIFLLTRANDRAKDRELRLYQAEAARAVAVANATAESAKADAAKANASALASQAELERLRRSVGPRVIPYEAASVFFKRPLKAKVEIYYSPDGDAANLASQLSFVLHESGWDVANFGPVSEAINSQYNIPRFKNLDLIERVGGQLSGLQIIASSIDGLAPISGEEDIHAPAQVFYFYFNQLFDNVSLRRDEAVPSDVVRIIIAPR